MGNLTPHYSEALVSCDWLAAHLTDPDILVFDCTTYLVSDGDNKQPYLVVSGRQDYDAGHIPGSGFFDLQAEFSVEDSPYRFTLPSMEDLAKTFARHGVGDGKRVVLYSRKTAQWATRFWWMLRWIGFDNACLLDGGYDKWIAEGRAVTTEACNYPSADLTVTPRPEVFVGKDDISAAIGNKDCCILNALAPDLHSGENPRYGRPGRIPGSVNVPAMVLQNPKTREMVSPEAAAQSFKDVAVDPDKRVLVYCGGGIAASLDAFLLHELGYRDVAVYDNSLNEWATDASLPMETD